MNTLFLQEEEGLEEGRDELKDREDEGRCNLEMRESEAERGMGGFGIAVQSCDCKQRIDY